MIIKLQDDFGLWIDDHKEIADKLTTDFSKRFKSSHNDQRTLAHLGLPSLILDIENRELIRLPNLEEVKNALFSIESNKTPRPDRFREGFLTTTGISLKRTCSVISYNLSPMERF